MIIQGGGDAMEHYIHIPTEHGELSTVIHYPTGGHQQENKQQSRWPLIIICHGFVGNKIGVDRLFVKAARKFNSSGYMVLRFDYAGCGESTGDYGAGGLDAMVEQTRRVVDYVSDMDCVDPSRIILLGHSLGGAASILTSSRDSRVKTLVLWSSVAQPLNDIVRIVGESRYEEANQKGSVDYQGYALSKQFFDSLTKQHPFQHTSKFSGDVFLVHGTSDEVIPVDYCFQYQRMFWLRSTGQCDKEVILQADHTYSTHQSSEQLLNRTNEWLLTNEKNKKEWNDWTI
jgi:dipeptidyl aminopeptidase/acylaminoacyl peptidase